MRLLWAVLLALVSLGSAGCSGCGATGQEPPVMVAPTSATLVSVIVDPSTATAAAGTTRAFVASEVFSDSPDAVNAGDPRFVPLTWSTSDAKVATVDDAGLVTTHVTGDVKVIATDPISGVAGTAQLVVDDRALVSLAVTPALASVPKGRTRAFVATATFSDHTTADVTNVVAWSSAAPDVATIDASGLAKGVAVGSALIQARHAASGMIASATLQVTDAVLESVLVGPPTATIAKGATRAFVATGVFTDGTVLDLTKTAAWSTADAAIASIESGAAGGLAKGLAVGATLVTARDPVTSVSGTARLQVTDAILVAIDVAPAAATVPNGARQAFAATARWSDATTTDVTFSVRWTSSDAAIATIAVNGVATARAVGQARIFATDPATAIGGFATLTVTDAVMTKLAVAPTKATTPKGVEQAFEAIASYSDGHARDVTTSVTWASTDPSVAAISNALGSQGRAQALAIGTTTISATDPTTGLRGFATMSVTEAVLVAIDVTPVAPTVPKGRTQAFVATGVYSDATTRDLTETLTWASSDASIASISDASGSRGLATALSQGKTTITARPAGSTIVGSTTMTVTDAALVSLEITPRDPTIAKGLTQQFRVIGVFTDATRLDLTTQVAWSTNALAIASISNAAGAEGLATANGTGSAIVTAASGGVSASTTLTVTAATIASISVSPATASIPKGLGIAFVAIGRYTDGTTIDLTDGVSWSSSDDLVATVSNAPGARGLATGVANGAVTITATLAAISGTARLTVTDAVLVALQVTPSLPSIPKGTTQAFAATGVYSDGRTEDLTSVAAWSSGDLAVAAISNASPDRGVAKGLGVGASTITAAVPGGVAGSTTLTVTSAVLVSIQVTPVDPSIAKGTELRFTATGLFSDASTQDLGAFVTWTSSDATIASVSNVAPEQGVARGLAIGAAVITATDPATGISGATSITVTCATLVSIGVTPVDPSVPKGTMPSMTAIGTYTDGTVQDLTTVVTWSSSDPTIATVSSATGSEGLVYTLGVGATTITATTAGVTGCTRLTVTDASLLRIEISPTLRYLPTRSQEWFTAIAVYSDATTSDVTATATWQTCDAAVAGSCAPTSLASISMAKGSEGLLSTFSAGGKIRIAAGLCAPDADCANPASWVWGSENVEVVVATQTGVSVTPDHANIPVGGRATYTANAVYTGTTMDGETITILRDITQFVSWTSSNPSVAWIGNAPRRQGLANGKSPGVVTITATDTHTGLAGTGTLTVTNAKLVTLTIAPIDPTIPDGTQLRFHATGAYDDGSTYDVTPLVSWTSTDDGVSAISNAQGIEGVASAKSVGFTTVAATDPISGKSTSTTLHVANVTIVSIAVTPTAPITFVGAHTSLGATATYSDGSTKDVTLEVTWGSTAPSIATISNAAASKGIATGVAVGDTFVTATYPQTTVTSFPPTKLHVYP